MYQSDTGYFYFYDDFVNDRKYQLEVNKIETRLLELGLNGRKERLSVLKNAGEIITDGIKRGAKTIIVIGNDATMSKVISIVAEHPSVVLGMIPVGPNQRIADLLGIPEGVEACNILSKRIMMQVDLGKVNDNYFLFSLDLPAGDVTVKCDNKYSLSVTGSDAHFHICNIAGLTDGTEAQAHCNPTDGKLEAIVSDKREGWSIFKKQFNRDSVFKIKRATISAAEETTVIADGQTMIKTPATVEVVPKKLRLIVGRQRQF